MLSVNGPIDCVPQQDPDIRYHFHIVVTKRATAQSSAPPFPAPGSLTSGPLERHDTRTFPDRRGRAQRGIGPSESVAPGATVPVPPGHSATAVASSWEKQPARRRTGGCSAAGSMNGAVPAAAVRRCSRRCCEVGACYGAAAGRRRRSNPSRSPVDPALVLAGCSPAVTMTDPGACSAARAASIMEWLGFGRMKLDKEALRHAWLPAIGTGPSARLGRGNLLPRTGPRSGLSQD
jgi:hypothetical protein